MAELSPVAGAKFYIGGAKARASNLTSSDFSAEVWVEIGGWEQAGKIGSSAALISTDLINEEMTVKQKGVRNNGQMQNVFSVVNGDSGQAALSAAQAAPDDYAFKILYNDMPSGGTSGTIQYFVGLVMSYEHNNGGPNTVRAISSTIEVNSNVVTVPAA
jgi:hypothetical protein